MIKALIFDFDGLIIDTETPWFDAYGSIYKEHGVSLPLEEWAKCIGSSEKHFDPCEHLEQYLNKPLDRTHIKKTSAYRHALLMKEKSVNPGIEEYLRSAKLLELKIGLASSSDRSWVEKFLRELNLFDYFDYICTRNSVTNVKPDPELYLKVLKQFGITGSEAIAFEDSPNGAIAAKKAGIYCVIVPNEITVKLNFDIYDLRLNSLMDINLETIIEKIK